MCECNIHNVGMGCCQPVLGPIENYYTKKQVDKLITAVTASAVSEAWVENYAYDKATVEDKFDTVNEKMERINNRFDDYYTMRETSSATEIASAISAIEASGVSSAIVETIVSSYTYSKSEINDMNSEKLDTSTFNVYSGVVATEMVNKAEKSDLTGHTADTSIHVTTSDKLNWNGKQDVLVSGVNIKTINGNSLLGSGNIEIEGGSGSGITSGEVQDMLTAYTYDKETIDTKDAQKLDITAFSTYSGEVSSQLSGKASESDLEALEGTVSAHTANNDIHVTTADKTAWNAKVDANELTAYTENTAFTAHTADTSIHLSSGEVQTQIDSAVSGKASNSDLTAHTSNNDIHVTAADKTAWNAKVDTDVYSAYTAATDSVINGKMNTADFNIYSAATETKIDSKPNVWMGTPSQWRDISGSTVNGTIYLVL